MVNEHWTDEQLVGRLYGIAEADTHLDNCAVCRARWTVLRSRRRELLAEPAPVEPERLAAQRRAIYERIERPRGWRDFVAAPLYGAVAAAALALVIFLPSPRPESSVAVSNDAQFFTEISSMVETAEPEAATPIRGLFQE